jgi:hypothetical protein
VPVFGWPGVVLGYLPPSGLAYVWRPGRIGVGAVWNGAAAGGALVDRLLLVWWPRGRFGLAGLVLGPAWLGQVGVWPRFAFGPVLFGLVGSDLTGRIGVGAVECAACGGACGRSPVSLLGHRGGALVCRSRPVRVRGGGLGRALSRSARCSRVSVDGVRRCLAAAPGVWTACLAVRSFGFCPGDLPSLSGVLVIARWPGRAGRPDWVVVGLGGIGLVDRPHLLVGDLSRGASRPAFRPPSFLLVSPDWDGAIWEEGPSGSSPGQPLLFVCPPGLMARLSGGEVWLLGVCVLVRFLGGVRAIFGCVLGDLIFVWFSLV